MAHTPREGPKLIAATRRKAFVLSLGLLYRQVEIDPRGRAVTIRTRKPWFHRRTRVVPFEAIERIDCTYEDLAGALAWRLDVRSEVLEVLAGGGHVAQ